MRTNKYCNIQDGCKLLKQANAQYNAVVQQNQSLQAELRAVRQENINLRSELIAYKCDGILLNTVLYKNNEK